MNIRIVILGIIISTSFNLYSKVIDLCHSCEMKSLKQAILVTKPYDTIKIKKGIYKATNLFIDKSLTIIGENYPTIDGSLKGDIFKIKADHVSIIGLNIINVGKDFANSNTAIRVHRSKNFNISSNRFENVLYAII